MALTKGDKTYIKDAFSVALNKQELKFENKLDEIGLKFENKLTEFKSEFFEKIDPILKEVVASREERVIRAGQHKRNQERIETLEKIHPKGKHLFATS